jgi:hypothetical protein
MTKTRKQLYLKWMALKSSWIKISGTFRFVYNLSNKDENSIGPSGVKQISYL